jgi:hypothetical protein
MEFVDSINHKQLNNNVHNQNDEQDANCYFENRLQTPIEPVHIPYNDRGVNSYPTNSGDDLPISSYNVVYSRPNYSGDDLPISSYNVVYSRPNYSGDDLPISSYHVYSRPNYSNKYSNNETYKTLEPGEETSYRPSKDTLVNTDYTINTLSNMVDVSTSYGDDNINFMRKNYRDIEGGIDNQTLVNSNQERANVTNNNTYTNSKFWTNVNPGISTNEYLIRDQSNAFYDAFHTRMPGHNKGFTSNDNYHNSSYKEDYTTTPQLGSTELGGNLRQGDKKNPDPREKGIVPEQSANYMISGQKIHKDPINIRTIKLDSEPKVSVNYVSDGGKVIHDHSVGHAYRKGSYGHDPNNQANRSYKKSGYNNDLSEGMITYYEDDHHTKFNREFGLKKDLREYVDVNGSTYNKFVVNNSVDHELTPYERNIMLQRNEKMNASINETMRYD